MQNNLTEKDIETINKRAEEYDIEELKIKDKEEIFKLNNFTIFNCKMKNVPAAIFKLTNLKILFISSNISDGYNNLQLPKGIWDWSNLESLCIHCGNLESLPSEIEKLINLKTLHIICCNLSRLPKEIYNLINLELLYIDCPNLENFPDGIEKLINLKTIYIRNCNGKLNLQDLLVKGIVKLNNLKWLSLDIE